MPLLAKFLAILNLLAVGLFIYLAGLDYSERQVWTRAAFLHELAIDGLPADADDTGPRSTQPIADDLGDADEGPSSILQDLFSPVGGKPVRTQDREVERARAETMSEIDGLADEAKRNRLKELLLALAQTFDEREKVAKMVADKNVTNDELKKKLEERFEQAAHPGPNVNAEAKRRLIAHLLYNLKSALEWHQRVMAVVGLAHYLGEAEGQAKALREMTAATKSAALDEKLAFEADFLRQRDRIVALSQDVERQKTSLAVITETNNRQMKIVMDLNERKAAMEKDLDKAREKTKEELVRQDKFESELFAVHRKIGMVLTENQGLERDVRILELGTVRGGQR